MTEILRLLAHYDIDPDTMEGIESAIECIKEKAYEDGRDAAAVEHGEMDDCLAFSDDF